MLFTPQKRPPAVYLQYGVSVQNRRHELDPHLLYQHRIIDSQCMVSQDSTNNPHPDPDGTGKPERPSGIHLYLDGKPLEMRVQGCCLYTELLAHERNRFELSYATRLNRGAGL